MQGFFPLLPLLCCKDVRAFAPRPPPAITHSRVWAGLRPKTSYTWQNSANYNTNVARARKLVVFDFDHTMIGCDSDEEVLAKYCSEGMEGARARLEEAGKQRRWASVFADELRQLQEGGVSMHEIEAVLQKIRIDEDLKYVLQILSARRDTDVRILSDANTWFIETVLKANGMSHLVSQIVSNIARVEGSKVQVLPYHTTPHPTSSTSPANLCKGRVMRKWMEEETFSHLVYCGDGSGDFEGAMAAPANSVVLAKKNWQLHQRLQEASDNGSGPRAQVVVWDSQEQLASTILRIFQLPTRTNAESIHARNDMSHHSKSCPEEVCIPSTLSEGIKVMAGVEQAAGMNNIANIERKIATVRAGTYDSSL